MSDVVVISPDKLAAIVRQAVRDGVKKALADAVGGRADPMREEDAAAYLGIARNTLRFWRSQGRGPAYRKLGKTVVYARQDLDAWNAQNLTFTIESPGVRHGMPC